MNILILINNAPRYINFLKPLGDYFKSKGHKVVYACESHLPEVKYNVSLSGEQTYYFTEFRKNSDKISVSIDEDNINLRKFYYSCYDRNFHFGNNADKDKIMDSIIIDLLNYFNALITNEAIDLIIYENVSNSFAYAAYTLATKKPIKYFGLITSRIPNRFEIWEDEYGNVEERKKQLQDLLTDEQFHKDMNVKNKLIVEYLRNFTEKEVKPDYMKKNPTSMNMNYFPYYIKKLDLIVKYIKYYNSYPNEVKNAYQSAFPIKVSYNSVVRSLKRSLKIKVLKRMYDDYQIDEDSYLIFPMHFQPESSTSVNAMYYDNQYEAIKNIVFSLPIGTDLYVKDHPNGIGFQSMKFYKQIKRLPNVKYIDPLANTKELIKNSKGVVTLTSTMGYEALLLKKPVITLGKVFYNYHPYCYNASSYNEIYDSVMKALHSNKEKFEEYNLKFLYVYFKDSYEGGVFKEDVDVKGIYDSIMNRIKNIEE